MDFGHRGYSRHANGADYHMDSASVTESTLVTFTFTGDDGVRTRSVTVSVIVRAPATQPLTLPSVSDVSYATGDIVNLELPAATQGSHRTSTLPTVSRAA